MERGAVITVHGFRGRLLTRRVWGESGSHGVLVCSEDEYQHAMRTGEEPLWAGFPRSDVVGVDRDRAAGTEEAG